MPSNPETRPEIVTEQGLESELYPDFDLQSVLVVFDGESKCGKTTIVGAVYEQASLEESGYAFDRITKISAGNMFRAVALYKALIELSTGEAKTQFDDSDTQAIRNLLQREGIEKILQEDENIGQEVSTVAQMVGVQALCGAIFCDAVQEAFFKDGGKNLVVVDARDPVGHMVRNNILGTNPGQIPTANIIPFYIETPAKVAAAWKAGKAIYDESCKRQLDEVNARRYDDANRDELPVIVPEHLHTDFTAWETELFSDLADRTKPITPYRFDNGQETTFENIRAFGKRVARVAHHLGRVLFEETPMAQPPLGVAIGQESIASSLPL